MTRHENAPGQSGDSLEPGAQKSNNQATASTRASLAHRRLTVLDCACGHVHHVDQNALAELDAGCKPELVGVAS